jgi:hypothetical protein
MCTNAQHAIFFIELETSELTYVATYQTSSHLLNRLPYIFTYTYINIYRNLQQNRISTLPAGLFQGLTQLKNL